jgi:hypothetical protein
LRGKDLELVSVARRMSWAAKRTTTRDEDIAYSLLGIFDVNMPLLYGEGKKAFARLEEEILKVSDDQSLFAWGLAPPIISMDAFAEAELGRQSSRQNDSSENPGKGRSLLRGLLADSPAEFVNSGEISPLQYWSKNQDYLSSLANKGVRIQLPLFTYGEMNLSFAVLGCRIENDYCNYLGIPLRTWGKRNFYGRLGELVLIPDDLPQLQNDDSIRKQMKTLFIQKEIAMSADLAGCFFIRDLPSKESGYYLSEVCCVPSARYGERARVLTAHETLNGPQALFVFKGEGRQPFAVVLGRDSFGDWAEQPWAYCQIITKEQDKSGEQLLNYLTETYKAKNTHEQWKAERGSNVHLELDERTRLEISVVRHPLRTPTVDRVTIQTIEVG